MPEARDSSPICDCHIHVFAREGLPSGGAYAPPRKDLHDFVAEAAPCGVRRAVLIQASVDGTDNSRILSTLRGTTGIGLRGVATIAPGRRDLQPLHDAGIRGVRIQNRARIGRSDFGHLPALSRGAAAFGWHLELNTDADRLADLPTIVSRLPEGQSLVLDHIAHIAPDRPDELARLCRLLETGRVWVKLSPTRVSLLPDDYGDLSAILSTLLDGFDARCIWGSDWPHVMTEEPGPGIAKMIEVMRTRATAAQFRRVMWENPARLYDFDGA